MDDSIIKIQIASMICDKYYDKIRMLACTNMEESDEYKELLTKIKHCVKVENEEYHQLETDELLNCIAKIEENKINNPALPRIYSKLMYEMRLREGTVAKNGILLSDAITTKLLIDIFKKIEEKLQEFSNDSEIQENDITALKIYHKVQKFTSLTANNYIESLAIKHDFEPSRIPTLHFDEIENNFNVEFIKYMKKIFLKYAIDSIDEYFKNDEEDEYAKAYETLFELSRIECILNQLDKEALQMIQKHIEYKSLDNYNKEIIKGLIKKRKEELN